MNSSSSRHRCLSDPGTYSESPGFFRGGGAAGGTSFGLGGVGEVGVDDVVGGAAAGGRAKGRETGLRGDAAASGAFVGAEADDAGPCPAPRSLGAGSATRSASSRGASGIANAGAGADEVGGGGDAASGGGV